MGYFQTFLTHNRAAGEARRVVASIQAARDAGRWDLADTIARAPLPPGTTITGGLVSEPQVPAPPRFLDTAPVGSGKSRAYRQRIAMTPPGTKIVIAVPDQKLAEEAVERLAQDAPGKTVMVWKGEAQPDPLNPGERMCRRHEEVAALRRAGGKREDLCGSAKRGLCPFHATCGYRRQLGGAGGADVVVVAGNAFLADAVPSVLKRDPEVLDVVDEATGAVVAQAVVHHPHFDFAIIDEPVVGQLMHGLSLDEPERPFLSVRDLDSAALFDPPHGASQAEIDALEAAKSAAGAVVKGLAATRAGRVQGRMAMGEIRSAFGGVHDGDIERRALDARKACLAAVVPLKDLKPEIVGSMDAYAALFGARMRTNTLMIGLSRLFGAIASAFSGPRRGLPDQAPTHNLTWAMVPDGARGQEPGVNFRWLEDVHADWAEVPTLILDATAPLNPVALEKCWPGLVKATVPAPAFAPGAVHVRQVHDWSGSYTKLKAMVASGELARLARFLEIQNARVGGGTGSGVTALAVVSKFLKDALLSHWKGSPPQGLDIATFGALRGQDKWRGVSYLAVIGRPLPPTSAVEDQAALIKGIVPVEVRDYARVDADYVMSNGEVRYRVEGRPVHPDAAVESFRFSVCEAELVQSIGRARAIRRTEPGSLRIDVLTNVPVPGLVVDELVTLDQTMAEADGGPVMLAASRGVVLEPGSQGFWRLIAEITGWGTPHAARLAAVYAHSLKALILHHDIDLERVSAHPPGPSGGSRPAAATGDTSHASAAQSDTAGASPPHAAQALPPASPAVHDLLAAPWVPLILRSAGGRYAVRAYVRGKDETEARGTLDEAARLAGTTPPVIVAMGHHAPPSRRRKSTAPSGTTTTMQSPGPQDAPVLAAAAAEPPAPSLIDAAPEGAGAEKPAPSTTEPAMPQQEPAPPPTTTAEEKTITVTSDHLKEFGRALGLAPPTIRKTIEKFRVVARRDGPDEMAAKAITALISEAANRRTCTPAEARAAVSGLTRAA